jgi:hypothetical protein
MLVARGVGHDKGVAGESLGGTPRRIAGARPPGRAREWVGRQLDSRRFELVLAWC